MTCSDRSFAIYRLPWTDIPILVMQNGGENHIFTNLKELNGQKGFVVSPFHFTDEHPGVIIRPDITASGWEEIEEKISSVAIDEQLSGYSPSSVTPQTESDLKNHISKLSPDL